MKDQNGYSLDTLRRILKKSPQKFESLTQLIDSSIDGTRDIFVNRPLKMSQIKYIGFDMDYTLAIYNKREIEELAFKLSIKKLIKNRAYPEEIMNLDYHEGAMIRGLLIDREKGNLLKINRFKQFGRGTHGTCSLADHAYENEKIDQSHPRFASIDTLFSLPEAYLYARLIDLMEEGGLPTKSYDQLFEDVRDCIDLIHKDGTLKSEIAQDLPRYIYQDPHLPLTLDKFRDSGKKLFLLTNSEEYYTHIVMDYLLKSELEYPSWQEYFDIIVVDARKPSFFKDQTPFYELDSATGKWSEMTTTSFLPNKIYKHGNYTTFEQLSDARGKEVLYIGDHIYGDILRSGKDSNWRTVLVVQELEEELSKTKGLYEQNKRLQRIANRRDKLRYELHTFRSQLNSLTSWSGSVQDLTDKELKIIEQAIETIQDKIDTGQKELEKLVDKIETLVNEIDRTYHIQWGALFHERDDEISRFGDQVRDYACMYTSRVSNFFFYPTDRYFKSLRDIMPHDRWLELSNYTG